MYCISEQYCVPSPLCGPVEGEKLERFCGVGNDFVHLRNSLLFFVNFSAPIKSLFV